MAVYTPQTENLATYTNLPKQSRKTVGEHTFDELGDVAFDDVIFGATLGSRTFDDFLGGTFFTAQDKKTTAYSVLAETVASYINQAENTAIYANQSKN